MTPEGEEFVALSMAPQTTAFRSGKIRGGVTSIVAPQVSSPGNLSVPSMLSQVRLYSISQKDGHSCVPDMVLQFRHSCAAALVLGNCSTTTIGCDYLALSITPKGNDFPSSGNGPKGHGSPELNMTHISHDFPLPSTATKGQKAPPLLDGVLKDQIPQCEADNKFPRQGFDTSSNIATAADTLVALSTLRERSR